MASLIQPACSWKTDLGYIEATEKVHVLLVVNDSAERGVKLCHDFRERAKKEGRFQNILQTVQNDRSTRPNLRKKHQISKEWFLTL